MTTTARSDEERDEILADRYGRRVDGRGGARIERWSLLAGAVLLVVVAVFWLTTQLQLGASGTIQAKTVAFEVVDASTVTVDGMLSVQQGTAVQCAFEATNEQHLVVGWLVIDVPASEQPIQSIAGTVRTTQPASGGVVKGCWIP